MKPIKPTITRDRFGPGWICRHFLTNTRGSGSTPAEAYAAWQRHVSHVWLRAFPTIDPEMIPVKERP
jgi:hypothetical protein